MMTIETSRTADAVTESPRGGAMGAWGLWLGIIVLAMFNAGLATAALYLETTQPSWPPADIEVPARTLGLLTIALLGLGAASATWGLRQIRRGLRRLAALALLTSAGLSTGSILVLAADLAGSGFRWDEHSYTSVYWALTGFTVTFVAVGVMMTVAVLVQTVTGLVDERRHLELTNTVVYLWFVFVTAVVLLGLVHALPLIGDGR